MNNEPQPKMNMLVKTYLLSPRRLTLAAAISALVACAPLSKPLPGSEAIPSSAYGPVDRKLKEKNASLTRPEGVLLPTQRVPAFDST